MTPGGISAHHLAGSRWWVTWHLLVAATLPALAGLVGLHYQP